ncbi:DUF4166 domain-containing protein [Sphingomonas sp. HF-S3]|uniref:DUF4166 domain-containing protein n=1 Tax=Sphingomonas rustica TaxID=3103142 RepID=A0ABV0B635_9SPHN
MTAQALAWRDERVRRRCAGWRRTEAAAEPQGPFRRLLGDAWHELPAAVRTRFARHIGAGACVAYVGEVVECRMSRTGWVLAQLARLVGGPLPLTRDTGVAASVSVTGDVEGRGQYWTRQYGRRSGFPQVIHSAKQFAGPTGLEEYLGLGMGIALRLRVEGGALLFESDHYFLRAGVVRVRIPDWTIGRLTIGHVDLGGGRFAFTLDLDHPLMGRMVRQVAVFADAVAETAHD